MSPSLDLVQLRSLLAIADCGGFGRAAAALHVSQPTISQHVRLLEKRLRRTLVERDGRHTRFTADGELLLLEARRILAVHDEALARLDDSNRTTVVIGSTETAADQLLPELLSALKLAYPQRQLQFHIDRSTQMTEAVTKGSIDLAILLGFPGDTIGRTIGSLELRWYSHPQWEPPSAGEPLSLVAYAEPCGMRQRALTVLHDTGRQVRVTAESTSLDGVIAAARAGLGVAVLPTAGKAPQGLIPRVDLPDLGLIGVNLAVRRGLDIDLEGMALTALEEFFSALPGRIPGHAGELTGSRARGTAE